MLYLEIRHFISLIFYIFNLIKNLRKIIRNKMSYVKVCKVDTMRAKNNQLNLEVTKYFAIACRLHHFHGKVFSKTCTHKQTTLQYKVWEQGK